jgi:histidinol dehydrogenase
VEDVRVRGDAALLDYTERFDRIRLKPEQLRVPPEEIEEAVRKVPEETLQALRKARDRLAANEEQRLKRLSFETEIGGVKVSHEVRALRRVGCYVPGGKAAYPSSLVMNVTPAKVAGVSDVIVATPPSADGSINPLILAAADACGADAVFRAGGAQAVAALAFGTETVPRVDKIVGPGNQYVTAAKMIVQRVVAIDKPAGPTEILILADDTADPRLIALDLVSQAEHGAGGICGVVTDSFTLAERIQRELEAATSEARRGDIVRDVLAEGGFIYVVNSIDEAVEFADRFAPEHLEVQAKNPRAIANRISGAGLILLGGSSPVSATDYALGVNHVLPTEGYGRVSGGITVLDYLKPVSVVEATLAGLAEVRGTVARLAEAEGLPNHAAAVEGRFRR